MSRTAVDPATLAVVNGWMNQVADEMDAIFVRAAFSTVISEQLDRACGLHAPDTGDLIAQGRSGLPNFVGSTQFGVKAVIRRADERGGFSPGDIYMLNDPYVSGTHLHDVKLVAPVFVDGEVVCLLAVCGHWVDIGSARPGGYDPLAVTIHEEGILIPVMRLGTDWTPDENIVDLIMANLRLRHEAQGDLEAALAALRVGNDRVQELVQKYGISTFRHVIEETNERAEAFMKKVILEIPNGNYSVSDQLDNDGISETPLTIALTMRVNDKTVELDFSGSSPVCAGPYNTGLPNVYAAMFVGFKHVFPDIPLNAGAFAPISVSVPEGCFLNASHPAPHEGYLDVTSRVMDVVLLALSKALPSRVPALPYSTLPIVVLSDVGGATGKDFVMMLFAGGGYGGNPDGDGLHNGALPVGIARVASVEVNESRFPIRYRTYGLREGSGGSGRYRGGCGSVVDIELMRDSLTLSSMGDRLLNGPSGAQGGSPGAAAAIEVWSEGAKIHEGKISHAALSIGDRVILAYPGGGGYGPPDERDPADVQRDIDDGLVESISS